MKIIKPMRLGLLHKVFEHRRESYLTVSLFVCFPFAFPRRFLYEASMWQLAGDELGKDAILDECMGKQRGELLVTGRCFTPGGVPRQASSVRVRLGSVDKTLYVVGDRRWGVLGMSDPEPFTEMPVGWSRAFGGEGFAANPLGKGVSPVRAESGAVHPLPNVEDPRHLIMSPKDRPTPVGFEGYELTWPQRFSKIGTYDEAWVKDGFPGFARDLDYSFFNTAPADQQIEGFFRGDETFFVENMHPDKPRLEGALPGVTTRCFVTQQTDSGDVFREAVMRLDTIRLFPRRERGILVFRGVLKIGSDDAADVLHILAGCEDMGAPKPVEHYQTVLSQRLDKKKRHLYALRDIDLMPPPREEPDAPPLPDDQLSGLAALIKRQGFAAKNQARGRDRRRAELQERMEEYRDQLRARGLNPDLYLPADAIEAGFEATPDKVPPTLDELPEVLEQVDEEVAQHKAKAEAGRAEAEAQARAQCEKLGKDYDAITNEARKDAGGPPKFSAQKELENLRDLQKMARNGEVEWPALEQRLADPNLEAEFQKQEEKLLSTYRKFAHHFPAASRLEGDEAMRLRDEVIAGHAAGQSFAGRDLTGADLSHLDLSGIHLEGAMLETAALTGTDLRGANLAGAVLVRADLEGANLTEAKLVGANFGAARMCDVVARGGVDFTGAMLAKADLTAADLTGACLTRADLSDAIVRDADFSQVVAKKAVFMKVDFEGATLAGADLQRCTFLEVNITGVDFSGSNLSGSTFVTAQGDGAVFRGAKLDKLRVVKDSSLAGADFQGASLQKANLMGTRLTGSDFTDADLRSALLNDCDLSGSTLDRAVLVEAMLVRTNLSGASLFAVDLMQSILQKANVRGAQLEKANLFGADTGRMVGDDETSLAGANVKRVNFVAAQRPNEQG